MFNEAGIIRVRNVNGALARLRQMMKDPRREYYWHDISPRGMRTMEYRGPMITEYKSPTERVLWFDSRDANPFFHLMEAIWILAGRSDVAFLAEFNKRMADYSDDQKTFHAPYGHRLRRHFYDSHSSERLDQIAEAIRLLRKDHSTRQVVLNIWDPEMDLGMETKDMPCNDMIMLKVREEALNMTVSCRSNDALWGAYGANAVQFSMIQEFIASAVGVEVGVYRQVSDSFHVYTDQEAWRKVVLGRDHEVDYYDTEVEPYALFQGMHPDDWREWLLHAEAFCNETRMSYAPFFTEVAEPMRQAWRIYKNDSGSKSERAARATDHMLRNMADCDWRLAGMQWMDRRAREAT